MPEKIELGHLALFLRQTTATCESRTVAGSHRALQTKKALTFVNALSYVMSANRGNVLLPPPLASPLRRRVSEPCLGQQYRHPIFPLEKS